MIPSEANAYQRAALAAFRAEAAALGGEGEAVMVEGTLIYQMPLPNDPDVTGVLYMVDAERENLLLFVTLPRQVDRDRLEEAALFVARQGCSRRFGALEFDPDHGTLRIRADIDSPPPLLGVQAAELTRRALALARAVSPAWQALCRGPLSSRYRFSGAGT